MFPAVRRRFARCFRRLAGASVRVAALRGFGSNSAALRFFAAPLLPNPLRAATRTPAPARRLQHRAPLAARQGTFQSLQSHDCSKSHLFG